MPEPWVDEALDGAPTSPTPEFAAALADELKRTWDRRAMPSARRRWWWLSVAGVVAAAAVGAAVLALVSDDDPRLVTAPPSSSPGPSTAAPSSTPPVSSGPATTAPTPPELTGGRWIVTAIDGVPYSAAVVPWVEFISDGWVLGHDGCNRFGTKYLVEGDQLTLGGLVESTTQDCGQAPDTNVGPPAGVIAAADGLLTVEGARTISYRRLDSLPVADRPAVLGSWSVPGGGSSTFRADGAFRLDGCLGRWTLDAGVLTIAAPECGGTLLEVGALSSVRSGLDGELYLIGGDGGEGVVVRLDRAATGLLDELVGRRWVVESVDGEPWTGWAVPYVEYATDGQMSGFDGCNWYDQFLAPDLAEVVTPGTMTATGCVGPFVEPVDPTGAGASLDGDVLTLRDDDRTITYRPFDAQPLAEASDVVGRWTGVGGQAELAAGGALTTNGCTGRWSLSDGLLTVEVTGTVDGRCGTALVNELPNPAEVRVGADGALLLAETGDGNVRIVRLDPA